MRTIDIYFRGLFCGFRSNELLQFRPTASTAMLIFRTYFYNRTVFARKHQLFAEKNGRTHTPEISRRISHDMSLVHHFYFSSAAGKRQWLQLHCSIYFILKQSTLYRAIKQHNSPGRLKPDTRGQPRITAQYKGSIPLVGFFQGITQLLIQDLQ